MYRMANYYLLEPERVHVGTMCGEIFALPISETKFQIFFDLAECGDEFYFNNLTAYVKKVIEDFKAVDFDPQMKREIILNSKMVILSSEICKLRIGCNMSADEIGELIDLADWILCEYRELWLARNYEQGMSIYENIIKSRKAELEEIKAAL